MSVSRYTPAQMRLLTASGPDDLTGEEGLGVEIRGPAYRTAQVLSDLGMGSYTHGDGCGDMYWNNGDGLAERARILEAAHV